MKHTRIINIGMILMLLVTALAAASSAQAGGLPESGLRVKKSVNTSVESGWAWDIAKTADQENIVLMPGDSVEVNYEVTLTATPLEQANYRIWGTVAIRNGSGVDAEITSIVDTLSDGTVVDLDCTFTLPYTLPAGWTKTCSYDITLDHPVTSNTVEVTSSIGVFSVVVPVSFGAGDPVNDCVDVFDSQVEGGLGTVCAGDEDKTFNYTKTVGPYEVCGLYMVRNEASFVPKNGGTGGFDVVEIPVKVICDGDEGCTLTPGYWKTHSGYGPAPYDDAWEMILPDGEDTPFFFSGQSYYDVLWTPSSGGNAYYILARAYIAAELNQFNGASVPDEVADAFAAAAVLFADPANTPAAIGALKGNARATWLNLAYILDRYNNGLYGPEHCSE